MPNATVQAAAEGLPEIDPAALIFPREKLAAMSMHDLCNFAQVLSGVQVLIAGHYMMASADPASPACKMLEDLSGLLISAIADISVVAQACQPADRSEATWRGWILLNHETVFSVDIADIAASAATLAAEMPARASRRQ